MFKHKITYKDFNGLERTEDFYFHLSLPEVTRLEAELGVPIGEYSQRLADSKELKPMLDFMEKIILTSYGKKTPDGRSFQKSPEIRSEFEYSQAYAELFEELLTNPELTVKFGQGIADDGKSRKNQVAPQAVSE